jgi:hypothetical protein
MAIDIIARGLATSLIGSDGRVSSDKMPVVGEISNTTGFFPVGKLTDPSMITGKTSEEILLMMLFGVVNPTFIDPSLSISLSEDIPTPIIGRPMTLSGALTFDRGSIDPAYGTSGYRAGLPTVYEIAGLSIATSDTTCNFSFEFTPTASENEIAFSVNYAQGEQPYNSIGEAYDKPLSAGQLTGSMILKAAAALYDATGDHLEFELFEDDDGKGYLAAFAKETDANKQAFAIADNVKVIGIKAFNSLSQKWEWLGGTAEISLTHFDTTLIAGDSLGEETNYILYTHNQPRTGARELRIYAEI